MKKILLLCVFSVLLMCGCSQTKKESNQEQKNNQLLLPSGPNPTWPPPGKIFKNERE